MDRVWLMCWATKSSYRVFAPGTCIGSDFDGEVTMHWTALMYDFLSLEFITFLALSELAVYAV
jgi:hypothetical protein